MKSQMGFSEQPELLRVGFQFSDLTKKDLTMPQSQRTYMSLHGVMVSWNQNPTSSYRYCEVNCSRLIGVSQWTIGSRDESHMEFSRNELPQIDPNRPKVNSFYLCLSCDVETQIETDGIPWFWGTPILGTHRRNGTCKWFRWWPPEFHLKSLWWCFGGTASGLPDVRLVERQGRLWRKGDRKRLKTWIIYQLKGTKRELYGKRNKIGNKNHLVLVNYNWCLWKQLLQESEHLDKGLPLNNDQCWVSTKPQSSLMLVYPHKKDAMPCVFCLAPLHLGQGPLPFTILRGRVWSWIWEYMKDGPHCVTCRHTCKTYTDHPFKPKLHHLRGSLLYIHL